MSSDPLITFQTEAVSFKFEQAEEVSDWLKQLANTEQKELGKLEYVFCSDEYLLEINKEYLNHDFYTDIITFPLQESPLEATIFISIDRVKENAHLYKASLTDELHRVIVHGLLHLLGYSDKSDHDKKQMRNKENNCLAKRLFI